MADSKLKILS